MVFDPRAFNPETVAAEATPENMPIDCGCFSNPTPEDIEHVGDAMLAVARLPAGLREQTIRALRALYVEPAEPPLTRLSRDLLPTLMPLMTQYLMHQAAASGGERLGRQPEYTFAIEDGDFVVFDTKTNETVYRTSIERVQREIAQALDDAPSAPAEPPVEPLV